MFCRSWNSVKFCVNRGDVRMDASRVAMSSPRGTTGLSWAQLPVSRTTTPPKGMFRRGWSRPEVSQLPVGVSQHVSVQHAHFVNDHQVDATKASRNVSVRLEARPGVCCDIARDKQRAVKCRAEREQVGSYASARRGQHVQSASLQLRDEGLVDERLPHSTWPLIHEVAGHLCGERVLVDLQYRLHDGVEYVELLESHASLVGVAYQSPSSMRIGSGIRTLTIANVATRSVLLFVEALLLSILLLEVVEGRSLQSQVHAARIERPIEVVLNPVERSLPPSRTIVSRVGVDWRDDHLIDDSIEDEWDVGGCRIVERHSEEPTSISQSSHPWLHERTSQRQDPDFWAVDQPSNPSGLREGARLQHLVRDVRRVARETLEVIVGGRRGDVEEQQPQGLCLHVQLGHSADTCDQRRIGTGPLPPLTADEPILLRDCRERQVGGAGVAAIGELLVQPEIGVEWVPDRTCQLRVALREPYSLLARHSGVELVEGPASGEAEERALSEIGQHL